MLLSPRQYLIYVARKCRSHLFVLLLLIFGIYLIRNQKLLKNSLLEFQIQHILNTHQRISDHEFQVYSQNKEDGVLVELIKTFNLNLTDKYFVEIGTETGEECNTR